MSVISISPSQYDLAGSVLLEVDPATTDIASASRRVSRTATLDGGCVITDGGFSHADRTFSIVAYSDDVGVEAKIRRLHQVYPRVLVSTPDGVFVAAIESVRVIRNRLTLRILVEEKISE